MSRKAKFSRQCEHRVETIRQNSEEIIIPDRGERLFCAD
jgi:hypothetical protein